MACHIKKMVSVPGSADPAMDNPTPAMLAILKRKQEVTFLILVLKPRYRYYLLIEYGIFGPPPPAVNIS
jgi:hypothetical protein